MILNNRAKNHTSERTIVPWTVIFINQMPWHRKTKAEEESNRRKKERKIDRNVDTLSGAAVASVCYMGHIQHQWCDFCYQSSVSNKVKAVKVHSQIWTRLKLLSCQSLLLEKCNFLIFDVCDIL